MKKNKILLFTKVIWSLFIVTTIALLIISYNNINNSITHIFSSWYVLLVVFFILYTPIITIFNARNLKWYDIKNRLIKFISLFVLFLAVNCGFNYVFKSSNTDLSSSCYNALGLSFAITFIDVTFLKREDN